ncbi:MAG: NAD(P)-dependent oxidoreductase [Acidobacteriota bacterium]
MNIGFIGLGKMGLPMAMRLIGAGHRLTGSVRTRRPEHDELAAAGGTTAGSPAEVAGGSQCVVLMLPGPGEIGEVMNGEHGLVAGLEPETLVLDCSTSLPSLTRENLRRVSDRGAKYVDAPVIGGPSVARDGGLQFLVGAEAVDYAAALPILSLLGKEIIHVGGPGDGHAAKLVANLIALTNMAVLGEGLALAGALGLDAEKMHQALTKGFPSSYVSQRHMGNIIQGRFTPSFALALGLKDLSLARDLAQQAGYPLFLGSVARELYQAGTVFGLSELNYTAVVQVFEKFGKPLRAPGVRE